MKQLIKILHIDDDPVMRMMIKKSLERSHKGFETISCITSDEFMNNLSSFQPDLLLIDIVMPVVNGIDLLKNVRQLSYNSPAIFMTGQENIDFEQSELQPIIGIISKPFSPMTLGDDLIKLWDHFIQSAES